MLCPILECPATLVHLANSSFPQSLPARQRNEISFLVVREENWETPEEVIMKVQGRPQWLGLRWPWWR